jgi:hypothetical protein
MFHQIALPYAWATLLTVAMLAMAIAFAKRHGDRQKQAEQPAEPPVR